MKSLQLGSTLLRASSLPAPFLLPAFASKTLSFAWKRSFSADAALQQPGGKVAPPRKPNSQEAIGRELDKMLGNPYGKSTKARTQTASKQTELAEALMYDLPGSSPKTPHVNVAPAPVRLDAYVGRSVKVRSDSGLHVALRSLQGLVSRNGIRREHTAQKYHERAGKKRKRLRTVRWRERFMKGFVATVQKVQKMQRMGW